MKAKELEFQTMVHCRACRGGFVLGAELGTRCDHREVRKLIGAHVRAERERMAIRLACACDVIEQEYGGESKVWKDVHAAFCEPSPLRDNAQKKGGD